MAVYKTFIKPTVAFSTITSYLFLCQLDIKQGRHGTSGGQWASTCRWGDAHVVVYQKQARGSANSAWQHQLISATCLLGTEEHMLICDISQHLNHIFYSVAKRANGVAFILVHFSWTTTLLIAPDSWMKLILGHWFFLLLHKLCHKNYIPTAMILYQIVNWDSGHISPSTHNIIK